MNTHSPSIIGDQNAGLLDALSDAYVACLSLAEQGFKLEKVAIIAGRPQIRIVHDKRCAQLNSVTAAVHGGISSRFETRAAMVRGVQVQWRQPL